MYLSDFEEGDSERTPTASLEADDDDDAVAIGTPRASPYATTVARRGSRKLTQYLSWQRSVAVREGLFSELEGATDGRHRVFAPDSVFSLAWALWITLLTLTYVALLEPIFVAFDAPIRVRPPWRWSALVDAVGGLTFLLDVLVTFRTAVVVSSDVLGRRKLVSRALGHRPRVRSLRNLRLRRARARSLRVPGGSLRRRRRRRRPSRTRRGRRPGARRRRGLRLLRLLRLARLRKHLFGTTVGGVEAMLFRETTVSPLALFACQTLYELYFVINHHASVRPRLRRPRPGFRTRLGRRGVRRSGSRARRPARGVRRGDVLCRGHNEHGGIRRCTRHDARRARRRGGVRDVRRGVWAALLVGSAVGVIELKMAPPPIDGRRSAKRWYTCDRSCVDTPFHARPARDSPRTSRTRGFEGFMGVDDRRDSRTTPRASSPRSVRYRVLEPALRRAFVAPGRDPGERALRATAERLVKRASARARRSARRRSASSRKARCSRRSARQAPKIKRRRVRTRRRRRRERRRRRRFAGTTRRRISARRRSGSTRRRGSSSTPSQSPRRVAWELSPRGRRAPRGRIPGVGGAPTTLARRRRRRLGVEGDVSVGVTGGEPDGGDDRRGRRRDDRRRRDDDARGKPYPGTPGSYPHAPRERLCSPRGSVSRDVSRECLYCLRVSV